MALKVIQISIHAHVAIPRFKHLLTESGLQILFWNMKPIEAADVSFGSSDG